MDTVDTVDTVDHCNSDTVDHCNSDTVVTMDTVDHCNSDTVDTVVSHSTPQVILGILLACYEYHCPQGGLTVPLGACTMTLKDCICECSAIKQAVRS